MTAITEPREAEILQLHQACMTCGASVGATGLKVCAHHVRDELGITYRQLDYAVRAGYLRPERKWKGRGWGSGSPRIWPEKELEVARLMGRLSAIGLPLAKAAEIARSGDARYEIAPGIWIEVRS